MVTLTMPINTCTRNDYMRKNKFRISMVVVNPFAKFDPKADKDTLYKNLRAFKSIGLNGIELTVGNPDRMDVEELKKILDETSMPVSAIGTGKAYSEDGLSFISKNIHIRKKAIKRVKSHIKLSEQIGKPTVIIGLIRGKLVDGIDKNNANGLLIEALENCAEFALSRDITISLEPINRYETNYINTIDDGLEFLNKLNFSNVGLLIDSFHMNIEEPSIEESIKRAGKKIIHFHIADSNRWAPGYGHINFQTIIESLRLIGYKGYLSAEILYTHEIQVSAKQVYDYMTSIMK